MKEKKVTVKIAQDTHKLLQLFRIENNLKNLSDAIKLLIQRGK